MKGRAESREESDLPEQTAAGKLKIGTEGNFNFRERVGDAVSVGRQNFDLDIRQIRSLQLACSSRKIPSSGVRQVQPQQIGE